MNWFRLYSRFRNADIPDLATIVLALIVGAGLGAAWLGPSNYIDGALVIAGITRYPPDNVMGVYYLNSWTVLHQAGAVPMMLGASQEAAVLLMNAAFGALSMCGVLMTCRILLRNFWAALAMTLFVLAVGVPVRFADYPQGFNDPDYGAWAETMFFLAVGLLGTGHLFAAGFAAFAAPAVHPAVGSWTTFVVCAAILCIARDDPAVMRRFVKGAIGGALFSGLSLLWYWLARLPSPNGYDAELYRIYMELWDSHRHFPHSTTILALGAVCVCILAGVIGRHRATEDTRGRAGLLALMISAGGSSLLYEAAHRYGAYLPELFMRAMPNRLPVLHLTVLGLIGAGVFLRPRWPLFVLPALAGLAALIHPVLGIAATLIAGTLLYQDRPAAPAFVRRWPPLLRGSLGVLICAVFAWRLLDAMVDPELRARAQLAGRPAILMGIENRLSPAPREPDQPRLLAGLSKAERTLARSLHRQGVVAVPGDLALEVHQFLHLPILLEAGSFDFVPYLPDTVTQVAAIVQDVFGVDFRNPPPELLQMGGLGGYTAQRFWSTLSAEDWTLLGARHCIGGVMVPADWVIRLSLTHDFGKAKYYRVPVELSPGCR